MKFPIDRSRAGGCRPVGHRPSAGGDARSAFTMVEIALCLAIIAFALVAIIGVLPTGLNVQKANREETVIDQDAAVWLNAIRNGALGYDDLTNYVLSITNAWAQYSFDGTKVTLERSGVDGYTRSRSSVTSVPGVPPTFALDTGTNIIGLLSTPKFTPPFGGPFFQSNYIFAYVRSISGSAAEKPPQADSVRDDLGFSYRMIVEITSYVPFDTYGTNVFFTSTNEAVARFAAVSALQRNSSDLRLTFRWPLLANGDAGNGRQTFRLFTGGTQTTITLTNEPQPPLYLFQPTTYVQAK